VTMAEPLSRRLPPTRPRSRTVTTKVWTLNPQDDEVYIEGEGQALHCCRVGQLDLVDEDGGVLPFERHLMRGRRARIKPSAWSRQARKDPDHGERKIGRS
jgi:hypothetical protein